MKKAIVFTAIILSPFAGWGKERGSPPHGPEVVLNETDRAFLQGAYSPRIYRILTENPACIHEDPDKKNDLRLRRAVPWIAGILAGVMDQRYRETRGDYLKGTDPNRIEADRHRYQKAELARNVLLAIFSTSIQF